MPTAAARGLLAAAFAAVAVLVLFLAGWQLAWRWGPYAAACFAVAAVGGLAAGVAVVAAARLGRRPSERAGR